MCCEKKTFIVIILILITLFLYFRSNKEFFTAKDYKNKIDKQLEKYDAKIMNVPSYNYNPIVPQCPEGAKEMTSWDANTKICKLNGNDVTRECPKDMLKEGDYCYLKCDSGYMRGNGLCWKQ